MANDLGNIPTSVLKEFAKLKGIPCSGTPQELRGRIAQSVATTVLEADPRISPYLTTRRSQNYRFYKIEGELSPVSDIGNKVRSAADGDPFAGRLRPLLSDTPSVVHAQALSADALAIDIAFRGDPRLIQDDWKTVEVHPLIQARLIYRQIERLVEIRGRRRKLDVIEEWMRTVLGVSASIMKFTFEEQMKLKQMLSGKTYAIGERPKAGRVGMIRLMSSDIDTDVEAEPVSLGIDEVLGKIGGSERTSPTLVFWDRTKVRPNEREGSFYIHRHVNEDQLSEFRVALLAIKQGKPAPAAIVVTPTPASVAKRIRELDAEVLQKKIAKVTWATDAQRAAILRTVSSLSLEQQKRMLPGFLEFTLQISNETASKLCSTLTKSGLLEPFEEALCSSCGSVISIWEGWDGSCLECGERADLRQTAYRVRGFIRPAISPDDVFKADRIRLNHMHSRLLRSRESKDNDEKKHALEDYVGVLFEMVEGIKCVGQDKRSASDEIDLLFQNSHSKHPLIRSMGLNFVAMCRNTAKPVDSKEMRAFVDAAHGRDCKYGVYASVNGFSGLRKHGHTVGECKQVIREARGQGIHIITLDLDDLSRIVDGKVSLPDVLWEKNNAALTF